jgi:predicted TIM-barrel fold metal-dependent hydrolase
MSTDSHTPSLADGLDTSGALDDQIFISVDDHLIEPPEMFDGRLPAKFQELAPRLVTKDDGSQVWLYDGNEIASIGVNAVVGKPPEEWGLEPDRLSNMRKGCYNVHERVRDMNAAGVLAQLNFPSFAQFCGQRFYRTKDKELGLAVLRAYNDWTLESWVGEYPDRFMACGLVPLWDPQLMAEEVARLAARGCHAVTFSEEPSKLGLPSLYSEHWDPFWAACEANEVVVCFHLGSSSSMPVTAPGAPYEATSALAPTSLLYTATDLVWAYFLRKYPNLKVALTEGGIGWIPYFLERTDWVYLRHHHWTGTDFGDRLPSDVFRDQVITCFIEDSAGLALRDRIGIDMICWEMDYPHADCTWPAGPESFAGSIAQLSREEADKITHLNAMRLFHFDPFSRRSRESSTVGALRALAGDVDLSYHHNEQVQGRGPVHATADMLASAFVSN